jgi:hypothetical protein
MKNSKTKTAPPAILTRRSIQIGVSLRPDRVSFLKQAAQSRGVSVSEIVRDLIDEARRQAERESMSA